MSNRQCAMNSKNIDHQAHNIFIKILYKIHSTTYINTKYPNTDKTTIYEYNYYIVTNIVYYIILSKVTHIIYYEFYYILFFLYNYINYLYN